LESRGLVVGFKLTCPLAMGMERRITKSRERYGDGYDMQIRNDLMQKEQSRVNTRAESASMYARIHEKTSINR
jgi:hypothetical protein